MNTATLQRLDTLANALRPLLARLPGLAAAVLVVILAHTLAEATWRFFPPPEQVPPPASASRPAPAATPAREDWALRVVDSHLFGQWPAEQPEPVAEAPIEVPETSLRLTLRGVYQGGGNDFAIIADAGGKDETYRVGDALPGGATLEEIHPDRVILKRNGRLETLKLPREGEAGRAGRTIHGDARGRSTASGRLRVPPGAGEVLARYRQRLLDDPQSVMDVVRAEPYRRGGRIVGYRVYPGRDRELLAKVGLQPGDVITEVNGLGLDNPLNGLEIMRGLQTASQVSVKVLRNGVEQEVTVSLP